MRDIELDYIFNVHIDKDPTGGDDDFTEIELESIGPRGIFSKPESREIFIEDFQIREANEYKVCRRCADDYNVKYLCCACVASEEIENIGCWDFLDSAIYLNAADTIDLKSLKEDGKIYIKGYLQWYKYSSYDSFYPEYDVDFKIISAKWIPNGDAK